MSRFRNTLLAGSVLLLAGGHASALDMVRVDFAGDTWLKATTAQASSLPASQKCLLTHNEVFEYSSIRAEGNHFHVRFPRAYPGCALTEGYLFQPHVSTHSTSLTVHANTVFKKQPVDSSTLPAEQKCSLPAGIYRTSAAPQAGSGHFLVNFASVPAGCGFSSGYVWDGHSSSGIRAVTLRQSTVFKRTTADSSTLPASDRCDISTGTRMLTALPLGESRHYKVTLPANPPGCGFRTGYLYYLPTTFSDPVPPPPPPPPVQAFTWPQPGSSLGSGWCICRNIGTSPHIGQDFVQPGAKRAVAIQQGTVSSITFSSSCGYILNLTDRFGGVWRYVHLNNPAVSTGQAVSNGQFLANISQYPTSSCGTGPHLHLERRSAGLFGDSPVGRSCQSGFRTCFYDPLTPFNRSAAVSDAVQINLPSTEFESGGSCKLDPAAYARVSAELRERLVAGSESGEMKLRLQGHDSIDGSHQVLDVHVGLAGNTDNTCNLSTGQDCAASWQLLAERSDGSHARVFFDAAVRDVPLQRSAKEAYCLPDDATGQIDVLVTTADGRRLHEQGRVLPPGHEATVRR